MGGMKLDAVLRKRGIDVSKLEILMLPPEELTRITDPNHPGFDPRVHWPASDADVEMMISAAASNAVPVLLCRRAGSDAEGKPIIEIIQGRRRHAAALRANELIGAGEVSGARVRLPIRLVPADNGDLAMLALAENVREAETFESRAVKIRSALNEGRSVAEIARICGMAPSTVNSYLRYFELDKSARKVFDEGRLPIGAIGDVADVPRDKQADFVAELVEKGATKRHDVRAASKAARSGKAAPKPAGKKMRSRTLLQSMRDDEELHSSVRVLLAWVLGEDVLDERPKLKAQIDASLERVKERK